MSEEDEEEDLKIKSKIEITRKNVFFTFDDSDNEDDPKPQPKDKKAKKVSFIKKMYISPIRVLSKENTENSSKKTNIKIKENSIKKTIKNKSQNLSENLKFQGTNSSLSMNLKEISNDILCVSSNVNILEIDKKIRDTLEKKKNELPALNQRLEQLRWIKENSDNPDERLEAKKGVWQINNKIREIESDIQKVIYEKKISPILEEYKILVSKPITKSFVQSNDDENTRKSNEVLRRKKDLLYSFINIAQNYINIKVSTNTETKLLCCENCGSTNIDTTNDENYLCLDCSACMEIKDDTSSFKDNDHINLSGRYTYSRTSHFSDVIKRFEAQQNVNISEKIYETLEKERLRHKISIETLTKRQIYTFLDQAGYSNHYKNINLIYSKMTGIPPPNIEPYKKDLSIDLKVYEEAFETIKGTRKNSLKVLYKLLKLLERRGYPTTMDDFYLLEPEKLREHDEYHQKICKKLGWIFIPTI